MPTLLQKLCLLSCLGFSLAACSPMMLDRNASKIQTQSTVPQNKQISEIYLVNVQGVGRSIGTISFQQTPQGLLITPALSGLPSGKHGFHIHENGSCNTAMKDGKMGAALAAGEHLNPTHVGHGTPENGHLGDLPALTVNGSGYASTPVLAPRLKLDDIHGRAIMIHAGGDNYSDIPLPSGGGGTRIACGIIP